MPKTKLTAHFQYRCRQCGEVYTGAKTSAENANMYLKNALYGTEFQSAMYMGTEIQMTEIHECRDVHTQGISDLVGYQIKEDKS